MFVSSVVLHGRLLLNLQPVRAPLLFWEGTDSSLAATSQFLTYGGIGQQKDERGSDIRLLAYANIARIELNGRRVLQESYSLTLPSLKGTRRPQVD